jgi:hypothetical protein
MFDIRCRDFRIDVIEHSTTDTSRPSCRWTRGELREAHDAPGVAV